MADRVRKRVRPISTVLLFLGLLVARLETAGAELRSVSLDQAMAMVVTDNLDVKISQFELQESKAQLARTHSYFLPKLGAESRYEYFDSSFQRQTGATSNLFVEWNLFNGFRDGYERKGYLLAFEQSKTSLEKIKLAMRAGIEAKFYRLLATAERIKMFDQAIERNDAQKLAARKRLQAGLASESDILEFDLYQTDLQAELVLAKSEYRQVQAEFRELIGQTDSSIEYQAVGQLTHYHIDDSIDSLRKRVDSENQGLQLARGAVQEAEANRKVAASGFLPQVDVRATYGSRGINETLVSPETAVMGLARWEFFSGFDTVHARELASAQVARAEVNLRHTELSAKSQVETAYLQLKAIEERVEIETENRLKAQKFYGVVSGEYKRGVKNSADMRSAAQILLQVTLRDIQYRSEFFLQKGNLEKAVGGSVRISKGSEHGHKD